MNRQVEDFSAKLAIPEIFREVCALISGISKSCVLYAHSPNFESDTNASVDEYDEDEVVMYTMSSQQSLMLWIHLSAKTMFSQFRLTRKEFIELPADSLAHAFRSDSGLATMNDVNLKISRRGGRSRGRSSTLNTRLFSIQLYHKTMNDEITKAVEQRVYGEAINGSELIEPVFDGISVWADPGYSQLNQMAKVSDQFRQMHSKIEVSVSSRSEIILNTKSLDVSATSTWKVELAQRADEDEGLQNDSHSVSSCTVLARDWYTVLQARRLFRRMVIGVLDNRAVVVYGFLKQGRSQSTTDAVNFYLTQT